MAGTTVLAKPAPPACRLAVAADLPVIEEMLRSFLLEQLAQGSPVQVTRRTMTWYRDLVRSYVRGSLFGVVVLALEGEQPVGLAVAGEDVGEPRLDTSYGRTAVVWGAWVEPAHRKQGTALAMLSYGQPFLMEQGFVGAVMSAREDNREAEALISSFGAHLVERIYRFVFLGGPIT